VPLSVTPAAAAGLRTGTRRFARLSDNSTFCDNDFGWFLAAEIKYVDISKITL
jgi:hypothetical protein